MSKDASAAFFGATDGYNPAFSDVFAQELTNVLTGNKPVPAQQVIKPNVITAAGEQAGKQVDALALETKKNIQSAKTTQTFSADKLAPTKSPGTATATSTSTTETKPDSKLNTATIQDINSTETDYTSKKEKTESMPTAAQIDAGTFDVPGSDEDILEKKPVVSTPLQPILVVPVVTTDSINFQTSTFIFIGLAAALLLLILFVYMLYTKKSVSETWQTIKEKFTQVFATKNKV